MDVATELPVAWHTESAHDAESPLVPTLLDMAVLRGFDSSIAILDKGYDDARLRGVRGPRYSPDHPAPRDDPVKAGKAGPRRASTALDLRRVGRQAWRIEVALPDRRVPARVGVDQG